MQTNENVVRYPNQKIEKAIEQFETPFFLYEEEKIRSNCKNFTSSFSKYFENFTPLYAVKANCNPHLVKIIIDEGFGLDCSSHSEVWLANRLDAFGMNTGNYNTTKEIQQVLDLRNILLNLDDISLLDTLEKLEIPEFLSFRINPNISKGGMESLLVAGPNGKFGVPWEEAVEGYRRAKKLGVKKFGIHMMTGSNVLDEEYFAEITAKLLEVAGEIHDELGIEFEYINIGGGFGVPYEPNEKSLDLEIVARKLRETFDDFLSKSSMKEPKLMIEPGRMIMADAGFLVTTVNIIKDGYKKFIGVNAGTNDLPRPAIYDAYHHISVLNKNLTSDQETVNVVGRLCENNDQFAKNRALPSIVIGDVLIIHNAGAHAYVMGHNYNGRTRSDEYLVMQNNEFQHIRRAETIDDLYKTVINF